MANFRKVLTSAAVFSLTVLVMAACAPKETIVDFTVVAQTDADTYDEGPITMVEGATLSLEGRLDYVDETTSSVDGIAIAWASDDDSIVSVTATGIITAESLGTTTITGTYRGEADDIVITVMPDLELP